MSLAEERHQPEDASSLAAAMDLILAEPVTEEELMSSGHELPEKYTCPLCCLPIALPIPKHSKFKSCCMKRVCDGCILASRQRGMGSMCAFCRAPTPDSEAAILAQVRKRVDAKDPAATELLASTYYRGNDGLQQDIPRAIELCTEAALLGDLDAHFNLGRMYFCGKGVEKDEARGIRHWKHAAIQDSLHEIKDMFMEGDATKAQYAEALKGYQNALEESKSPQREEAKAFLSKFK
ncbi:hypothetical protein THAOC_36225 [Thalassiosira oceanica]|uniref:RING-type domain-containing protein n=1 Tax=Thalassiosira oceanica TaxID=159749 RepID=K0R270_THAOC|nr:hypothetical protein THAOC_36225 [Thalassiosira oceanica]|eukprot:EJK45179.1 hypothetical protein THAOC_36225 [Thalassiosira oceanica]